MSTCDVCDRRLLRGEQSGDVPGGRPAPDGMRAVRAASRARGVAARDRLRRELSMAPQRPRRGRNLFERLRQAGRPNDAPARTGARGRRDGRERGVYDVLDDVSAAARCARGRLARGSPAGPRPRICARRAERSRWTGGHRRCRRKPSRHRRRPTEPPAAASRAGGACDRDVQRGRASAARGGRRALAGRAQRERAPGPRTPERWSSIVVAWELCWYRYEVDVEDRGGPACGCSRQGTELSRARARGAARERRRRRARGAVAVAA